MPPRQTKHWYTLARWRARRRHQLRLEPYCRLCAERGVVRGAEIVDHVEPHKGDWNAFWLNELQSLCKSCHEGTKQVIETRGYSDAIGANGLPLDPKHPCYHGWNYLNSLQK